jgi:hypothetical protein
MKTPLNIVAAIRTEELRLSKRELKTEMKAMGIRIHSFSLAQLTAEAKKRQSWFAHDAFRNVLEYQLLHLLRRAQIKTQAQKSKAEKSMASTVQISGA